MALISVRELTFGFSGSPLLASAELQVEEGERICLLGRNGEGKSTLLRLLAGELPPDEGTIARQRGLTVGMLDQRVPEQLTGTIYEVVAEGLGPRGELLRRHHQLTESLGTDDRSLARLEEVQNQIAAADAWDLQRDVDRALSKLSLDPDVDVSSLSAGMKRRVLLARALVSEPDLLLLDEPTNHLDIDAIAWLEEFLRGYRGTLLFVTHDRVFLQRLATRIIELDRGALNSWSCGYDQYLERCAHEAAVESKAWQRQDKKLASEEQWVRTGIRARRTRNEGRVRALERLREERRGRRERSGKMRAALHEGERSGQLVIDARNLSVSYPGKPVIRDFSTRIFRGDKIGLIGPNGVGKSTLLKLLLGELPPDTGTLRHGTQLEVAYFDQLHAQLDESKTVRENVADGQQFVDLGGRRVHVRGYLENFLFDPDRIDGRLDVLSGGERNRLLLARLFTRPANLLILDEPTNDLDIESLEVLEDVLVEYAGTLLIVSHDRAFLDNVVTTSYVFEGEGRVREIDGGYAAWERVRRSAETPRVAKSPTRPRTRPEPTPEGPKKLSFKERKQLEALPQEIDALEATVADWHRRMAEPDFFRQAPDVVIAAKGDLARTEAQLAQLIERWEQLEDRA